MKKMEEYAERELERQKQEQEKPNITTVPTTTTTTCASLSPKSKKKRELRALLSEKLGNKRDARTGQSLRALTKNSGMSKNEEKKMARKIKSKGTKEFLKDMGLDTPSFTNIANEIDRGKIPEDLTSLLRATGSLNDTPEITNESTSTSEKNGNTGSIKKRRKKRNKKKTNPQGL
jgi:hypothetical protein